MYHHTVLLVYIVDTVVDVHGLLSTSTVCSTRARYAYALYCQHILRTSTVVVVPR